ncbi:FecR family protein [Wenyingzhuangia sp. 2_MG-2023]|nr:FecR family protein [Wenyingzhuangia sp. 2_MG-2023]MDO6736383.1 FecR family protein [Wenyingzhuangia sp. 2_MG-2023]
MKKKKILLKKIASHLSEKEEVLFQEWLLESEANRELYESLLLLKKEESAVKKFSEINADTAWKKVLTKKQEKEEKSILFLFRNTKFVAAAASILILISVTLMYRNTSVFKKATTSQTVKESKIKAGTDKAILTLGDGSSVKLNKGQAYTAANLKSNGEEIVYVASVKDSTSIEYNYLTVPRGGQFFVKLSDGTQVWLNSETKLKYPVAFVEGVTRKIELIYGEAYFDVSPSTEHKGAAFKVYHKEQQVKVIGTQFNIKAYKNESNIYTTLVEGKVSVSVNSMNMVLVPNQQSKLNLDNNSLTVSEVDVRKEIAWKDGVFNFDRKVLKDIMVVLSRWYDVDVIFENKELESQKFVGLINKNYSIDDILQLMEYASVINSYTINDRTIILK